MAKGYLDLAIKAWMVVATVLVVLAFAAGVALAWWLL